VQQPRNPLTYLIIGSGLGLVLGAVVGIAIGGSGRSAGPVRVETVVSTRTVNAGLAAVTTATTQTAPPPTVTTDTTTTDTLTPDTLPTTPTDTTTTPIDTTTADTTTTDTTTTPAAPNDVPPPDPYRPPRGFCSTHVCAPGFTKGHGYVVQCADGVWTMQGGEARACRKDGGLA
jgi:hypothetical protein